MSLRRSAYALVLAVVVGACAVGSVSAKPDGDGKPSWKSTKKASDRPKTPNQISADPLGDANRGVDIQSLAIFNQPDLDFIALSITGRDFQVPTTRSAEIYLNTKPAKPKPNHRIVAFNREPGDAPSQVRLYRVNGWSSNAQKRVRCDKLRVQFEIEEQSQIRVAVPRSCLRNPKGVLSANAAVWGQHPVDWNESPKQGAKADIAPGARELTSAT